MTDECARCGKPVAPGSGIKLVSVYVGVRYFHFDCIREEDTIVTLREARP